MTEKEIAKHAAWLYMRASKQVGENFGVLANIFFYAHAYVLLRLIEGSLDDPKQGAFWLRGYLNDFEKYINTGLEQARK